MLRLFLFYLFGIDDDSGVTLFNDNNESRESPTTVFLVKE